MDHVIERLGAWLGGELEGAESAAVEAHLEACADCRREADALQAVLRTLGAAPAPVRTASVWPAVRERTFAAPGGWFFGSRPLTRLGLGAAAVACGLLVGALFPRSGGDAIADASLWLVGSRALDEDAAGALDVWLDLAASDAEVER